VDEHRQAVVEYVSFVGDIDPGKVLGGSESRQQGQDSEGCDSLQH
jgi:hypothetical protein